MTTFERAALKWRQHFGLQLAVQLTSALPWRSFNAVMARVGSLPDVEAVRNAVAGHESRLRGVGRFWVINLPRRADLSGKIDRAALGILGNDDSWVSARFFTVEFTVGGVTRRGSVHLFTRRRLEKEIPQNPESPLGQPFWVCPENASDLKSIERWVSRLVVQHGLAQGDTLLELRAEDGLLAAEALDLGRRAMLLPTDARARNMIDKDTNLTPRFDGI